jgi:Predicted transcriptional regulators
VLFEQLSKLCKKNGTTPTRLALDFGLSRSNVTRWKNGGTPSIEILQKIAGYFNVSTDYLLTGSDKKTSPAPTEDVSDLEKVIIERSPRPLPDEQKKALMDLIDSTIDTFMEAYYKNPPRRSK